MNQKVESVQLLWITGETLPNFLLRFHSVPVIGLHSGEMLPRFNNPVNSFIKGVFALDYSTFEVRGSSLIYKYVLKFISPCNITNPTVSFIFDDLKYRVRLLIPKILTDRVLKLFYTQLNFVNCSYYFLNPCFLEECFLSVGFLIFVTVRGSLL